MKRRLFYFLLLFIAISISKNANAGTTYTWTGLGFNGNWTTAANWLPFTGYPGSSGTTDIAIINSSFTTVRLTSSVTISQLESTLYSVAGVAIQFSGSPTLTISGGISTAQPIFAATGLTFSGTGTVNIGGTSQLGYQSSMAISAGTTVNFVSGSTFTFPNNHSSLSNAGNLNFFSGSTLTLQDQTQLTNTGNMTSTKATITLSGSGSPADIINNQGNYTDHGSTINITGQNAAFLNSTSTAITRLNGTTMSFSSSNNGMSLTNAGFVEADSSATINLGTQNCPITNTGTFYAGVSNSACIINLTGQSSNINNTGTFYVGSTSGITMLGYQAAITTGSTAYFIFQSDANGSAYLGSVPASSVNLVTGTYYMERYITGGSPAYRGYRLFSSPVYASTVSSNNVYSLNYVKASALVTGSGGTAGGFDKAGNPSLYLYRENIAFSNATYISGNFRGIGNIASAPSYTIDTDGGPYNIPAGNGFLFWFRGDRATNLANKYTPGTSAESVTMTATGMLNVGSVTVHNWYTPSSSNLGYTTTAGNTAVRGDNLVGNPYPSSIDWETFQTASTTTGIYGNNVGPTIYVLDQVNQNYGAYTKGGGGAGTNNATNIIASGQGFFVTAVNASSPQLIFNETAKSTSQVKGAKLLMSTSPNAIASNPYLRIQINKNGSSLDDMLLRFNNSAAISYDPNEDAPYKPGFGKASLSSMSADNVPLAINTMPYPKAGINIPLTITATQDTIYTLQLKNINQVPQLFEVWLIDHQQKDSTDLRQNPVYYFSVKNSDSTSFGSKRFTLVIRQNPYYAYKLLNFNASRAANASQVAVTWTTQNEQDYTYFTVERSTDNGSTFQVIGGIPSSGQGTYGLIDKAPVTGANLYRLKQVDINDSTTYSTVVEVLYSDLAGSITGNLMAYPNPAIGILNLNIDSKSTTAKSYNIMIANSMGLTVKQFNTTQSYWQGDVNDLLPGAYVIKVINNADNSLVGNTRFVKL